MMCEALTSVTCRLRVQMDHHHSSRNQGHAQQDIGILHQNTLPPVKIKVPLPPQDHPIAATKVLSRSQQLRPSTMTRPVIAPAFCQVAWVVRDLAAAEKFFIETMGISRFMAMDNLAARDTEGTYRGQPGDWVCHLHIAYAGDTQIELIQPVSGSSIFQESLDRHGDAVQHVAYWLDDADYDAAAAHLEASGHPLIQSFRLPILRVGYFDTRDAIGVVTEIVGASEAGHDLRRQLKAGEF
jgi:methylmalonyl-CoA/ethylmalonyl-CoA epimerase